MLRLFLVGRWHLVCYYLCYILIRQICRLEKQFVKFINIQVGLVGQVVLFFFFAIATSDQRGWISVCDGTKVAKKMLTESGGAQRVMQNENLKYFIIPLVTHKCVRESWVAECVSRDTITCGSFTSIIPVRQVVAQHVVIYWVVVGWRFFLLNSR